MKVDPELQITQRWVQRFVVGKGLCPFAGPELSSKRLHFALSNATDADGLLADLRSQLRHLQAEESISTSLLVHPKAMLDFLLYNEFLDSVDELLRAMNLEGVIQVASFHPDYRFAGTDCGAAENFTNRSPYPMLHLLPEAMVSDAISAFGSPERIFERNIEQLRALGSARLLEQWRACFKAS